MILVFDLDDTLYDELTYVRSGFRVVAGYIEKTYAISEERVFSLFEHQMQKGRGAIFDAAFQELGIFSKRLVRRCVGLYRLHRPEIELYPAALRCLERFHHYPIYIVTDGNINAQKNKLIALGFYNRPPVQRCYLTYRYGRKHVKPSPYCFFKIAEAEGVTSADVCYIADNPHKDFVGIKPFGFKTVRVLTGQHRYTRKSIEYEANYEISSLDQLTEGFFDEIS